MKFLSKQACIFIASAAVLLTGCSKKPLRPDPSATLGPTPGGSNLNPTDVATTDANSALTPRDNFDANGQLRNALGDPVYFAFDHFEIKKSEQPKLQAAKDYLDKNPTARLLLEGHCDWRGTSEYNLALGDKRANSAKSYLVTLGVSADKLETLSKGSEEAKKNGSAAEMEKDRHVDLVVLKQ